MDIGTVLLVAVAGAIVLVALRSSGNATELMSGLFAPPRLGWPSGVQEDDDALWSWDPGARGDARDDAVPRIAEAPSARRLVPGHPRLRRGH